MGSVPYALDLAAPFTHYELTANDRSWGKRLAQKLNYSGKIFYFVRTSLALEVGNQSLVGAVYQRVDLPNCFYVTRGDYLLRIGKERPSSSGVGGFSLHFPPSKNFLACLNCHCSGVPVSWSTPITKGQVYWLGH